MRKLNELKIPFAWPDRKPILLEKCLYLPKNCPNGHFGPLEWDAPAVFDKRQTLMIEYCSGNGQWIAARAAKEPEFNWVAVEQEFERARKIWLKAVRSQLGNLFVVCGEALDFTRRYLADQSVQDVYVNFPDPWPKRRHAKNRLVQRPFVEELARVSNRVTLVTDDADYSRQMIEVFGDWKSEFGSAGHMEGELPGFGTSYFHELWKKKQRVIRTHRFFL